MAVLKKYSSEELKHIQNLELEILSEIIQICDKYELRYYLFCGTLLGGVRHKGFIPWDDDIDIVMFREDYDKLLAILDTELNEKYEVLNFFTQEDYFFPFTKVSLKGTRFEEWWASHVSFSCGIFIDIFPLDNMPKSRFKQKLYHRRCSFYNLLLMQSIIRYSDNLIKNVIQDIFFSLFKPKTIKNRFFKFLTKYSQEETDFVTCFHLQKVVQGFGKYGVLDKEDFEPFKTIKFEYIDANVPKNTHKILTGFYGDYMVLPPKDKRYNHAPEVLDFGKY